MADYVNTNLRNQRSFGLSTWSALPRIYTDLTVRRRIRTCVRTKEPIIKVAVSLVEPPIEPVVETVERQEQVQVAATEAATVNKPKRSKRRT